MIPMKDLLQAGDRWYTAYGEGDSKPLIYSSTPKEFLKNITLDWSTKEIPSVIVYYLNGKQKVYKTEKNK